MSIARQNDLIAGEVWQNLYQAFANINFNASDPVSINNALQAYARAQYPESYNDWIVSSEFVAIIDLLSWLAGTLAFKTDIAARENFIDTAEARESILRLARFLSYNPNRCQPATGILKIIRVATDDDVIDSFGVDLINTPVLWNDPNNSNWYEQFTLILNNAFSTTNPFGVPLSTGTVSGIATQLYRINGLANAASNTFSANVSGIGMNFEICNADFIDGGSFFERDPNPQNAMQCYYLNDGSGNGSTQTGFFLLFKQGITSQQVFTLATPVQNQLLDIGATNINQTDVWVNTVDDNGNVLTDWTPVSTTVPSNNITYNNIPPSQRNIFSVLTRDNDQISIRFSDGNFGNAPTGNIAVTYRVSNALTYQISPSEIQNTSLQFPYTNAAGVSHTLTLTFSLTTAVSNAAASETIEQIRQRAPQVYATQNRMVSGEDYNTFPLSSNLAVKIKAVNRLYSGQSRYIDLHDPTGTYQDLTIFADDGIFFADQANTYFEIPLSLNLTSNQLLTNYIQPAIDQYTTANLIRDVLIQNVLAGNILDPGLFTTLTWTASQSSLFSATGYFNQPNTYVNNLIQPGAMIQFSIMGTPTWVAVIDIQAAINTVPLINTAGPVTLSQSVPTGSPILAILPQILTIIPPATLTLIETNLSKRLSFSLFYDYQTNGGTWIIQQSPQNDFGPPRPNLSGTTLLMMNVNYITGLWRINSRGLRYVFESISAVEWFDNGQRGLSQPNDEAVSDNVRVLKVNTDLTDARGYSLGQNYDLTIDRLWTYADGTPETRRTTVMFTDSNNDGYPDQPDMFYKVLSDQVPSTYLFWSNQANPPYDQPIYTVVAYETDTLMNADTSQPVGTVGFQVSSSISYVLDETFWVYGGSQFGWQQNTSTYRSEIGRGSNFAKAWVTATGAVLPHTENISFQWKHYANTDERINPSQTNIVDVFVLTFAYDSAVRQWIANGAQLVNEPAVPSDLDLSIAFAGLETSKMFSDEIIWHPVSYKYLFGASADPSVQAQFKVVRVANSAVSDGEIQSQIIAAINAFFATSNWDFGETFYFTELAAYVHQQLVGLISSFVIVPLAANAVFGDGFEISCNANEIFISTAQISDILLIQSNTAANLRIA